MKYFQPILNYGLSLILKDILAFRASGNSIERVVSNEMVARFITKNTEYYSKPSNKDFLKIKYTAFLPHSRIELSVFRVSDIYEKLIWKLGKAVARLLKRELIGRGEIKVHEIIGLQPEDNQFSKRLAVLPDPLPLSHANIVGYPQASDSKMQKAAQKQFALELASKAGEIIQAPS